jgi:hypothetical protein
MISFFHLIDESESQMSSFVGAPKERLKLNSFAEK